MNSFDDFAVTRQFKAEAKEARDATIIRLSDKGLKATVIAARVGCRTQLIYEVLQRARAITPEISQTLDYAAATKRTEGRQRAAESEV